MSTTSVGGTPRSSLRLFDSRGWRMEANEEKRDCRLCDVKPTHRLAVVVISSLSMLFGWIALAAPFLGLDPVEAWYAIFDGAIAFMSSRTPLSLVASAAAVFWTSGTVLGLLFGCTVGAWASLPLRWPSWLYYSMGFLGAIAATILRVSGYFLAQQAWLAQNFVGGNEWSQVVQAAERFRWMFLLWLAFTALPAAAVAFAGYGWGLRAYPDCDRSPIKRSAPKTTGDGGQPQIDDSRKPLGDAAGSGGRSRKAE